MSITMETFKHGVPWENKMGYCQAAKVGNTIYVSGQLSHDENGKFIGENDFEAQVRTAHKNIDKVLDHFGATRNQIAYQTALLVKVYEHNDLFEDLNKQFYGDHTPANTTIGVNGLAFPEQLIEIAVTIRTDLKK